MKPALLDTNVLLAFAWPNHQHHEAAHKWFRAEARHGWATCALTEISFVRLSSNRAYTPEPRSPEHAAALLGQILKVDHHRFWRCPTAASPALYAKILGHQQVNDAYLVEVARRNRGQLVTFDTRISAHTDDAELVRVLRP